MRCDLGFRFDHCIKKHCRMILIFAGFVWRIRCASMMARSWVGTFLWRLLMYVRGLICMFHRMSAILGVVVVAWGSCNGVTVWWGGVGSYEMGKSHELVSQSAA